MTCSARTAAWSTSATTRDGKTYDTGNDASSNPAVLAMREQAREQLDVSQDTFRYDYFACLQRRGILNPDE